MTVLLAGGLIGLVVGALSGAVRGGSRFGVAYGLLAAGIAWSASSIVAGNRADGMAGIGDLVMGGVLFWFLVVPAGVACIVLEYRERRRQQGPTPRRPTRS